MEKLAEFGANVAIGSGHNPFDVDAFPGEIIFSHVATDENSSSGALEFVIKRNGTEYTAFTPYRNIVYSGKMPGEAIGVMLRGLAELSRDGSFIPERPHEQGSTPIQHSLYCLTQRLAWQVDRRKEHILTAEEFGPESLGEKSDSNGDTLDKASIHRSAVADIARDNEVIAALATAVAALARVKDL